MPEFKERAKVDKPKRKPTATPTRQVARLMKEKYRQQLDQPPEKTENETSYVSNTLEGAGHHITDTVQIRKSRPSRRQRQKVLQATATVVHSTSAHRAFAVFQRRTPYPASSAKKLQHPPNKPTHGATAIYRHREHHSKAIQTLRSLEGTASHYIFKAKASAPAKPSVLSPPVKQTAQRHMRQQAIARAKQAAKAAVNVGKKATVAVAKAVASLVSSLVGLLGGGVLLVILIFIVAIAAIASSPFGIFFAGGGGTGGSSVATVSVSEAVCAINAEYNDRLEELQTGNYDSITLDGQAADWPDVLAVFASRYAAAEDGVDVATLDADRVSKLTATFWDMTSITSEVESIRHADSDPNDEIDDSWTERILHITVTPKTAENMKTAYSFTSYQISALDELLSDRVALASLAGSLEITNADVKAIIDTLPVDLPADRQKAVETALRLVGKVNYFWGGKSYVMGRDSAGKLLICHCSSGRNNVVVTEFASSGFTVLGRPGIYAD